MNTIQELLELKELNDKLSASCAGDGPGLEAIDYKTFIQDLKDLTYRSSKLAKVLVGRGEVVVKYAPKSKMMLSKRVMERSFLDIGKNEIFVPISFKGKLTDFSSLMLEALGSVENLKGVIDDANGIFAGYISNPDELSKMDPKRVPALPELDRLGEDFARYFGGREGYDRSDLSDAYYSYKDFHMHSESIDTLTGRMEKQNLRKLKASVDDFYETLGYLERKISVGDVSLSRLTAKAIGELIYRMADWVALYSLYCSKLSATAVAHIDTTNHLNELGK